MDDDAEWFAWIRTNPGTDIARLLAMIEARDAEIASLTEQRDRAIAMSLSYRLSVYWEMLRSQLRDKNAGARLSVWQRLQRGHRLGTMAMLCIKGPPYKPLRWMRWKQHDRA